MTTPDRLWRDNPYIPGKNNLNDIRDRQQALLAGDWANRQAAASLEFMHPEEAASFAAWARTHPKLDPNVWVPLAKAAVDPYSEIAYQVAEDASANDRLANKVPGQDDGPETTLPSTAPEPDPESESDGGFFGTVFGFAKDVGTVVTAPARYALGAQPVPRAVLTELSTPWQYIQAESRTNLGADQHRAMLLNRIAKANGMDPDDIAILRNTIAPEGGSLNAAEVPLESFEGASADDLSSLGLDGEKALAVVEQYREAISDPEIAEFVAGSNQDVGKVFGQTDAGVIYRSFRDGTPGNFLTQEPKFGSQYDPKKGIWIDPDTGEPAEWVNYSGTVFNPSGVAVEANIEALKAYDITTLEERKNGVAPVAWTLGRGTANLWYDPGTQAFSTWSGVIDMSASLTLDPVNLIPAGAFGKGLRGFTLKGRAFAGLGDDVLVATRAYTRAGPEAIPPASSFARTGAQKLPSTADDLELVLDPVLSQRGYAVKGRRVVRGAEDAMSPEGLVNMPHTKFVAKRAAMDWINSREGTNLVNNVAEMDNAYEIWLRSNGKMDGEFAIELAHLNRPEDVRAAIASRIGVDIKDAREFGRLSGTAPWLAKVPVAGPMLERGFGVSGRALESSGFFTTRGREALKRMYGEYGMVGAARSVWRDPFRMAPSSGVGFHIGDVDSVLDEMTNFFRGTRLIDDRTLVDLGNKVVMSRNGIERYFALYGENGRGGMLGTVVQKLVDEEGMTEAQARQITRAFAGGIDPEQSIWNNSDLGSTSFGATADGAQGRSLLLNEMLGKRMYLPDYRTLRRATSILGRLYRRDITKRAIGEKGAARLEATSDSFANALHSMSSAWRNAVLVRGAYTIRDIGEQAFSLSLAGGPGLFTRPDLFVGHFMQAALAMEIQHAATRVLTSPFRGVYNGTRGVIANSTRALINDPAERQSWMAFADLPDEARPRQLRGLNAEQIGKLWENTPRDMRRGTFWYAADREAMREYLALHEGVQWLFPSVRSKWARLNGETMFERLRRAAEGDEDAITDYYHELNATSGNMLVDEPVMRRAAKFVDKYLRDAPEARRDYVKTLIDNHIAGASADALMRRMAKGESLEEILFTWRHTSDWGLRRQMRPDLWQPEGSARRMDEITEAEDLDYLRGLQQNLRLQTGEDRTLLDALAARRFEGKPLTSKNTKLVDYLMKRMDDEEFRTSLPTALHGIPQQLNRTTARRMQAAVNNFFHWNGEMSDLWARSPTIRHFWSEYVLENTDELSPAARAHAVAALRAAGDIKMARKIARKRTATKRLGMEGTMTVEELEAAASGYARRMTARTFYNAHKRQNYAVALRTMMPFIQATFNTFKRWGLLSLQNPHYAYRTLKPFEALRDRDSAVIYEILGDITGDEGLQGLYTPGNPEASVDGFFFHDAYGERKFMYPIVRSAYNYLWRPVFGGPEAPPGSIGVSSMSGLNVAGHTINPGVGPAVTLPAVWFARDNIYHDDPYGKFLRWLFPYGYPTGESGNLIERSLLAVVPTAIRKAMVSEDQQANMAMKIIPGLLATGEYGEYPADRNRVMVDANELASRVLWFQSIFGSFTPSTIQWQQAIRTNGGDPNGALRHFMMQDILAQEMRRYTEPSNDESTFEDYAQGTLNFLHDYGIFALFSVQPRSEQVGVPEAMSPTADVWSFRTDHPDVWDKYRAVIPFFFPGGDPSAEWGEAQENLYKWQISSGERGYKSVNDYMSDAEAAIGWILYATKNAELIRRIPDADAQTAYRNEIKQEINLKFPGWSERGGPDDTADAINLLRQAAEDPDIETLPGTPYIAEYIRARDDALDELEDAGLGDDLTADYAALQRARLWAIGQNLVKRDGTGTFAYAWSRLFSGELELEE